MPSMEERRLKREARALEIVKAMRPQDELEFFSIPTKAEERQRELVDAPEHVYFVYSAGLVKIGYSTDWRARVDAVCQGCSHHAELVLVMPGDRKLEEGYHALFAESRAGGEWFRLDGNVRRFLDHYASDVGRETLEMAHQDFLEFA